MKDYSKPAFPSTGPVAERGMSLRDYFAVRAPKAPDWFRYQPTTPQPQLPSPICLTEPQRDQFSGLGECFTADEVDREVVEFAALYGKAEEARAAWRDEQRKAKFFAWAWYYADAMLAARSAK
ncbi:hypothetical protein QPK31_23410 [Massilia sp. YIM B02769]|uniref:hypothetical protein n=1 Tax=Massilia sp. YIM B02769 TaxID=3050129 RepID=UPI0025B73681|nr:hypothetical protein [Massilia sp. YIM B02769]MDN4061172.1 hypothetical protein [Massilia sp. YIM B02769]